MGWAVIACAEPCWRLSSPACPDAIPEPGRNKAERLIEEAYSKGYVDYSNHCNEFGVTWNLEKRAST